LQAYQAILPEINALGASLVAVSPQTPEYSLSMAEKHQLGFTLLSDAGNRVARQYGLVFALGAPLRRVYREKFGVDLQDYNADDSYELPMPGTFVVTPDGIIRLAFVDPDYTQRLEPGDIIQKLRELVAAGGGSKTP
jgi:peroxiredoxin